MSSLVLYDSNYGNTKKIAIAIGKELKSTVVSVDDFNIAMLDGIKLLIIGSPIIGWRPTEKMAATLTKIKSKSLKGVKVTTFDTRVKLFIHGDAMNKMMNDLTSSGAEKIINAQAFYVKGKEGILFQGELEKAISWAQDIKRNF